MHKAAGLGFAVAIPYGHLHRYDFIVEGGGKVSRVQVKTTTFMKQGFYQVRVSRTYNHAPKHYTESEIDFVAVYVIPEDTWYIVPVREVAGRSELAFRPKGFRGRDIWAYYREAWHLLREPDGLVFG